MFIFANLKEITMKLSQVLTLPIQKAVQQLFDVSIDKVEFQITKVISPSNSLRVI